MGGRPMTDNYQPQPGQDPQEFLDSLTYRDDADTPALPPTSAELEEGMVTTSLKMPKDMRDRVRDNAAEQGITASMLIRQFIEMGLAAEQPGRMIPLSDAIRALNSLRATA